MIGWVSKNADKLKIVTSKRQTQTDVIFSRQHCPVTLRRFTELLFSILFSSDLAPGFPRGAALRGGATLDNNQNHQTKNSSHSFG